MSDDILGWLIDYTEYDADPSHRNKLKEAARELEALRAENARLRDVNRWNIERDGDDIYICESNHLKSDKCEYERWYPRAHVEALRAENARLREALVNITKIKNELFGPDWQEIEKARKIARAAIREGGEKNE